MVQKSATLLFLRCLICSGLLLTHVQAFSQAKISFQGVLKTASGEPVPDGDYEFTFSFWKSLSGMLNTDKLLKKGATDFNTASNQWSETVMLTVAGGIYSHNLGSVTELNPANFEDEVYLNIKVGSKDIVPRTQFTYAPFSFSTDYAQTVVCSGALGDVKYSILSPEKFKDVNGDCWVPLDGRTLATTDKLYSMGVTILPNAGGMFLRAQDFNAIPGTEYWKPKNTSDNDPERDHNSTIGMVQQDTIQAHKHTGTTNNDGSHQHTNQENALADNDDNDGIGYYIGGRGNSFNNDGGTGFIKSDGSEHTHQFTTNSTGDTETRPKNMNFWIYIRIN